MKEKYLRPALVNAGTLEGNGITPIAVAGITLKAAAALLGGYMASRAATKVMDARPAFKMDGLPKFVGD